MSQSLARIGSGSRSARDSSDTVAMASSQTMGQKSVLQQASQQNLQSAQSFLDVQDGYLEQIQGALDRMGELAMRASDVLSNPVQTGATPKQYALVTGSFTWDEARVDAHSKGGQLATVKSASDLDAIKPILAGNTAWLGASDAETEGQWKWVDGTAMDYSNWASGEPNNGGGDEDALQIYSSPLGKWNDFPGEAPMSAYVIEYPAKSGKGGDYEGEFRQLAAFIESLSLKSYNGIPLFDGNNRNVKMGIENDVIHQEGVDLGEPTYLSLLAPGDEGFFISGVQQAQSKLTEIDQARQLVTEQRASIGANAVRIESEIQALQNSTNNLKVALSRIRDVEIASEATSLAKNKLLAEVSSTFIHQFDVVPKTLMSLVDSHLL